MNYPKEVQPYVNVLNKYKDNEKLEQFDSFHMYDAGLAYPNGYYDARNFILVGYNEDKMLKRNLGKHDGLQIEKTVSVYIIRIFADGSYFVKFGHKVEIIDSQAVYVMKADK